MSSPAEHDSYIGEYRTETEPFVSPTTTSVSRDKSAQRSAGRRSSVSASQGGDIRHGSEIDLQGFDATFRDSNKAPLHSWFPYLEGYSPRFVERVRHAYLGEAKRIIEPFGGTGTTPIVLGQAGVESAFAEANPAMVFIAETKLAVLRLSARERAELAQRMTSLADELPKLVADVGPDEALRKTYVASFKTSIFFESKALEAVLRLRAVNDAISEIDSTLGDCMAVAVLSSLIPSSLLKRAGDLRYRTPKELALGLPHPVDEVRERLAAQATDLKRSEALRASARFVSETAGTLHEQLDGEWDGVITSPPYLNGTNYIRNARLELWYLRHLDEKGDLRRLRDRMITSGINDVHAKTQWKAVTPGVERVVRAIQENAYDSRIAKMVGGYFHDMALVFTSIGQCLRRGGRLCVDIGDSIYNGVHVPTDDLLVEVAESLGYRTLERVHLRHRVSKGGATVRQQLLVFEKVKK